MKFLAILSVTIAAIAVVVFTACSAVYMIAMYEVMSSGAIAAWIFVIILFCILLYLLFDSLYEWVLKND